MQNLYSQYGEELIVEKLLSQVSTPGAVLVEFGASRVIDNSNFMRMVNFGYQLVMIEADKNRFEDLTKNVAHVPNTILVHERVGTGTLNNGYPSVSEILSTHIIPEDTVAAVSVDVDGDDALLCENLGFVPPILLAEFNPTFGVDVRYRQQEGQSIGNSLGEIFATINRLGMYPIFVTMCNVIAVRSEYRQLVPEIDVLREVRKWDMPRFGWGYDGTLVKASTSGEHSISSFFFNGWAFAFLRQPLPKRLRRFKSRNAWKLAYFFINIAPTMPTEFPRWLWDKRPNIIRLIRSFRS